MLTTNFAEFWRVYLSACALLLSLYQRILADYLTFMHCIQ